MAATTHETRLAERAASLSHQKKYPLGNPPKQKGEFDKFTIHFGEFGKFTMSVRLRAHTWDEKAGSHVTVVP